MNFYGDFRAGQTVRCRFSTVNTSGVPTTLTSGAVIVSKDGSDVTPSGGVTLTTDVGSVTGRHHVVIDTSVDATTFTAGSDYAVRLSGSSAVGGTSVVGIVVGEWSIANRAVAADSSGRVTLAAATHTGAVIPTVTTTTTATNLTNLPTVPTDWLTAAGVKADAVTKIQVGLSTYAGADTSGTTTLLTRIPGTVQPQTGDAYARLGATPPTAPAIASAAWDLATSGHTTSGSFGAAMAAAGTAGDPWIATVPGSYPAGTAGARLGGTLNANIVTVLGGDPVPADLNNVGLKPTGLDQLSLTLSPGVPTTFRTKLLWFIQNLWESDKTPTTKHVKSGGTILTTQTVTDDGAGTESVSAPS